MKLKTIIIGSCVTIVGIPCKTYADGRVSIRIGGFIYTGKPLS